MLQVFLSTKHYDNYQNKDDVEAICSLLQKCHFKTVYLARDYELWGEKQFSAKELMKIAFREILESNIILVDTTESGTGLGVEAGYAFANGISVVTIAQEGINIPVTLQGISKKMYHYKNFDDLYEFIKSIQN